MEKEKTFKERYLAGEIDFEEIDVYSEHWGFSNDNCTLREYLGLDTEEEEAWIQEGEDALWDILEAKREKREVRK